MDTQELFAALQMLSKERSIPIDALYAALEKAIITAVKKDYKEREEREDFVFCHINGEDETMRVYLRKNVVSEILDDATDILPEQAQKYKENAKLGDIIEIDVEPRGLSRVVADKVKHVLRSGLREAENGIILDKFAQILGQILTVRVARIDHTTGDAFVELGKTEEILPRSAQLPEENFREGDLIKIYVADVKSQERGKPRPVLSRKDPGLVRRLFELEVPEIGDGTVILKDVSREAGVRTKVSVYSDDEVVDPVGACIGSRSQRIGRITDTLAGERIDIIRYSEDLAEYISAALSPAEVIRVEVDEAAHATRVIVPDNQLSLAIGNKGQNVRLAAKLTGWKIDLASETDEKGPIIDLSKEL
ncbi:MAG: transcription termination factor NusA [Oscillospiraceae bacterium]|jgi:N utilization substance protein A|nr:transcription termination factor NusA [Oscillospiraceae bacterium]